MRYKKNPGAGKATGADQDILEAHRNSPDSNRKSVKTQRRHPRRHGGGRLASWHRAQMPLGGAS